MSNGVAELNLGHVAHVGDDVANVARFQRIALEHGWGKTPHFLDLRLTLVAHGHDLIAHLNRTREHTDVANDTLIRIIEAIKNQDT